MFKSKNSFSIEQGISELQRIADCKIYGKYVPELFQYDGISFWWLFYPQLAPRFIEIMSFIKEFSDFLDTEKPDTIKITDNFSNFYLIKEICKKKNIELKFSKSEFYKFTLSENLKNNGKKILSGKIIQNKITSRKSIFYSRTERNRRCIVRENQGGTQ